MWYEAYLTADNILRAIAVIGGVISFIVYLKTELSSLRIDVGLIKDKQQMLMDTMKQLNTVLTQIAVQDARINMIEKDIDEIRHGKGMVT